MTGPVSLCLLSTRLLISLTSHLTRVNSSLSGHLPSHGTRRSLVSTLPPGSHAASRACMQLEDYKILGDKSNLCNLFQDQSNLSAADPLQCANYCLAVPVAPGLSSNFIETKLGPTPGFPSSPLSQQLTQSLTITRRLRNIKKLFKEF